MKTETTEVSIFFKFIFSLKHLWKRTCPATWFRKSREVLFDYGFKRKGLHEFEGYWIEAIDRKLSFCLFEYALNMQTISCSLEFVYCNWFCSNLNRLFLVRDQSRLEPLWQKSVFFQLPYRLWICLLISFITQPDPPPLPWRCSVSRFVLRTQHLEQLHLKLRYFFQHFGDVRQWSF